MPARSPFPVGARVQLHGYTGYPPGQRRNGFVGTVEGYAGGGSLLYGTTDQGVPWMEWWGALTRPGEREDTVCPCTCCPG